MVQTFELTMLDQKNTSNNKISVLLLSEVLCPGQWLKLSFLPHVYVKCRVRKQIHRNTKGSFSMKKTEF